MSDLKKIYSLIPKIMTDVGAIGKSGFNQHDNYKFRSIDDVYSKLQPALGKHGVFFAPNVIDSKEERIKSSKGTDMVRIKLRVRYDVYAEDGSKFETMVEGEAVDRSDKATNKALTAAFKYMLIQVFCIAVQGAEDADEESNPIDQSVPTNAFKEAKLEKEKVQKAPGEFVVGVGKFKDQKLKDLDPFELDNYLKWLSGSAKEKNKPLTGLWLNLAEYGEAYLSSIEAPAR